MGPGFALSGINRHVEGAHSENDREAPLRKYVRFSNILNTKIVKISTKNVFLRYYFGFRREIAPCDSSVLHFSMDGGR